MAYANGRIPLDKLVHLGANFYLPPGTAARWKWMVAQGKARWGVTFVITPDRDGLGGWNAYRPYDAQVRYKNYYGNKAAAAGYSSHGGWYKNQEVYAIDVDNWQAVSWDKFKGLANEAGFKVDFVSPSERWHIGDFNNPWVVPAFTQGGSAVVVPPIESEEDNMKVIRWNSTGAVFMVGESENIRYIHTPDWLPYLKDHYEYHDVDNGGLTLELEIRNIPWAAVEAVLRGGAFGTNGNYWSRITAEGEAIRNGQKSQALAIASQTKTLEEVLETAKQAVAAQA